MLLVMHRNAPNEEVPPLIDHPLDVMRTTLLA
jgi:hypothetical protein